MGTTKANRKSPAERAEQAKALQASIAAQVETLCESQQWRRYLDFVGAFHAYSLNNVLLIWAQCPHASQVAGFRKWQSLDRQVRKGEKALKIFGYSTTTVTREDQEQDTDPTEHLETREGQDGKNHTVRVRFPVLSVFDISQTDPTEGAEAPPEPVQLLTGEDTANVVATVTAWLERQGWTLTRAPIPGATNGYTTTDGTRRVVIDADLSPAAAAKTALHEAAHVILHADQEPGQYIEHRGRCETEAESVAYVVAGLLGIDTAAYSIGYIASWSEGDSDVIKDTAQNVLRAVRHLAGEFTDSETEGAEEAA